MVSNHLTHYMDSIVVFHSVSYLRRPYLVWPSTNLYVVAAFETMRKSGWLPRLMALTPEAIFDRFARARMRSAESGSAGDSA